MQKFDVIIIGSGLGGLLCGCMLAREGLGVCILEKQGRPGGNLLTFTRNGRIFETGMHYIGALGPGQTLARYWNYAGLMDKLSLQQLDADCFDRIVYGDREFPLAQGATNFVDQLLPYFPARKKQIQEYIDTLGEVVSAFPLYNLELPGNHREHRYTSLSIREHLSQIAGESGSGGPVSLSSVLAGNNFLYAANSLAPLHVASLISHSFISGAYRIIGGSEQVASELVASLRAQGGTLLTRHEVTGIHREEGKFVITAANGNRLQAEKVISGIHPATTMSMISPGMVRPAFRRRIETLQNTAAPFILFLGIRPGTFPYLNHNYYYHAASDPWKEPDAVGPAWPSMYLLSTGCSMSRQQFADTVTILTYMRYEEVARWADTKTGNRGNDYLGFKEERSEKLLKLVSGRFPELAGAIEHMDAATPLTCRDYTGIPEGSLYGIRKSWHDPLLTTVMPRTKIPGFYFTGQNTNLHGALGVTIGAVMTCGEILGMEYLLDKIKRSND
jgi:all-trans-retinol 13,14-reductase